MLLKLRHTTFLFLASEQIGEQLGEAPVDKRGQRALGAAPVLCLTEDIKELPKGPAGQPDTSLLTWGVSAETWVGFPAL